MYLTLALWSLVFLHFSNISLSSQLSHFVSLLLFTSHIWYQSQRLKNHTPTWTSMETSKGKESSFGLSYPMLTKTNYTAWSMKMRVFMQAHGVWELGYRTYRSQDGCWRQGWQESIGHNLSRYCWGLTFVDCREKECQGSVGRDQNSDLGADKVKKAKAQTLKSEFESLTMK